MGWVTNENTYIAYMDTQDIAKFSIRALQIPQTINQTFFLSGLKGWVSSEIISLCEQLAGQKAEVKTVPLFVLKLVSGFFGFFEWGQNISGRLAFVEILNTENNFSKSTFELYKMFKIDSSEIFQLDDYFLEFMGDTNYVGSVVKILEKPVQTVISDKIVRTDFRVQLPQVRNIQISHLVFWGNLARDILNNYQVNDYIMVEGYLSFPN